MNGKTEGRNARTDGWRNESINLKCVIFCAGHTCSDEIH